MKIGVLKERKLDERRVALRPDQAHILLKMGHTVYVEHGAGASIGFGDDSYRPAILTDRENVYAECELLLKVKCPLEEEYKYLKPTHTLFAFLHSDENIRSENIMRIVDTGVTAIAYEWVERNGTFPLLQPMSELTGLVVARKSMSLLMEHAGILGGRYFNDLPVANVMVIGAGHIGANAINVFVRNGFSLAIVDKHPETLDARITRYLDPAFWNPAKDRVKLIHFREADPRDSVVQVCESVPDTDIVICAAVRRPSLPKDSCEFLIDRESVKRMKPNRIICDATACDRDFIETAVSSESLTHVDVEEGIIHYSCDHMPSLVADTATQMLTSATFPYVAQLASRIKAAVCANTSLAKAVMCCRGHLVHEYSAKKKGLAFSHLEDVL